MVSGKSPNPKHTMVVDDVVPASSEAKLFRIAHMPILVLGAHPRQLVHKQLKSFVQSDEMQMVLDDEIAQGSATGQALYVFYSPFESCLLSLSFYNRTACQNWPMLASVLPRAIFRDPHARTLRHIILLATFLSNRPEYSSSSEDDSDSEEVASDILYELPPDNTISPLLTESMVIQRVVGAILQVPHELVGDSASKMLLYVHACVAFRRAPPDERLLRLGETALQWLQNTAKADLGPELEYCHYKLSQASMEPDWPQPSHEQMAPAVTEPDVFERCDFCGQRLGWMGKSEARCASGHTFVRCSLTFLAIQAPGHSRHCGVCRRIFLTDAAFSDNNPRSDHGRSLPRLLVGACDVCAFCGGKFTD